MSINLSFSVSLLMLTCSGEENHLVACLVVICEALYFLYAKLLIKLKAHSIMNYVYREIAVALFVQVVSLPNLAVFADRCTSCLSVITSILCSFAFHLVSKRNHVTAAQGSIWNTPAESLAESPPPPMEEVWKIRRGDNSWHCALSRKKGKKKILTSPPFFLT